MSYKIGIIFFLKSFIKLSLKRFWGGCHRCVSIFECSFSFLVCISLFRFYNSFWIHFLERYLFQLFFNHEHKSVYSILFFLSFYFTYSDACYLISSLVYLCFFFIFDLVQSWKKLIYFVTLFQQLVFGLVDLILFDFYFLNLCLYHYYFLSSMFFGLRLFFFLKNFSWILSWWIFSLLVCTCVYYI